VTPRRCRGGGPPPVPHGTYCSVLRRRVPHTERRSGVRSSSGSSPRFVGSTVVTGIDFEPMRSCAVLKRSGRIPSSRSGIEREPPVRVSLGCTYGCTQVGLPMPVSPLDCCLANRPYESVEPTKPL